MLPNNQLSTVPVNGEYVPPDNIFLTAVSGFKRMGLLEDYELGPIDVGDSSKGVNYRPWKAELDVGTGTIYVFPAEQVRSNQSSTVVLTDNHITELSLAFDQVGRPIIAYVANQIPKLYWYDSVLGAQTTTDFLGIKSPVVFLDDKRPEASGSNDVVLCYIKDGSLYQRLQRDRFSIEYLLTTLPARIKRIYGVGMNEVGRIMFYFRRRK